MPEFYDIGLLEGRTANLRYTTDFNQHYIHSPEPPHWMMWTDDGWKVDSWKRLGANYIAAIEYCKSLISDGLLEPSEKFCKDFNIPPHRQKVRRSVPLF